MNRLFYYLFFLIVLPTSGASAQQSGWRDSLNIRLRLLSELTQSGNYEKAQLEAQEFRTFIRSKYIFCPPKAFSMISAVYFQNKDKNSMTLFFAEAESDANRDRNPETKAALLAALVQEHERWGEPERALACQKLLAGVQDSLLARNLALQGKKLNRHIDSLETLRRKEGSNGKDMISIERNRALLLGGAAALIFLAMLAANARVNERWRRKMETRELEMELQMANLRQPDYDMPPAPPTVTSSEVASGEQTALYQHQRLYPPLFGMGQTKTALVIEPNRQIALYIRSLLIDRFQVETADDANEGLKMAAEIMPDLIVCDAVLNGKTGIEVVRQVKLSDKTNHIPVLILSERYGSDAKLDALRAGADAWFTRPVLDTDFDRSVVKLLDAQKEKHEQFARFIQLYYTDARIPIQDRFLAEIVRYIEHNIASPDYMPDDIARKMQMSNNHFVKKLRILTGKEPNQLIREMRLEKARFLLEKRAGTPQAIAELVGFSNPGSFAMAFKEYFGENTLLLQMPNRLGP